MHRYTSEQHEFFREAAPGHSYKELHAMFIARFGVELTETAVKSYMTNHKLKTETYRKYGQEHIDWLRRNIHDTRFKDLTRMFNERFGFNISISAMISLCDRFGLHNGIDSRFNPAMVNAGVPYRFHKGHVPANRGKKGVSYPGCKATQFKKGNMPQTWKPVGTETVRGDGYTWVKVAEPNKWREKHRLIWEAANGPVPPGYALLFGDGNRLNVTLENIILVSRKQLAVLNKSGLVSDNVDFTRSGIIMADILMKRHERIRELKGRKITKREKQNENQRTG